MPWFRVQLHGSGIALEEEDGGSPAIGFYTTRDVRAVDPLLAQQQVMAIVLDEWRGDGDYVAANRGDVPSLTVEACWPLGFFRGYFGRRPGGYTFYLHDD
jgi:hypothetical protein